MNTMNTKRKTRKTILRFYPIGKGKPVRDGWLVVADNAARFVRKTGRPAVVYVHPDGWMWDDAKAAPRKDAIVAMHFYPKSDRVGAEWTPAGIEARQNETAAALVGLSDEERAIAEAIVTRAAVSGLPLLGVMREIIPGLDLGDEAHMRLYNAALEMIR